jgi:hypothetical protein
MDDEDKKKSVKRIKLKKPSSSCVQKPRSETEVIASALREEEIMTKFRDSLLVEKKGYTSRRKKVTPDKNPPIESFFKEKREPGTVKKTREALQTFTKNKVNTKPSGTPVARFTGPSPFVKLRTESLETVKEVISEFFYGGQKASRKVSTRAHKGTRAPKHDALKGIARAARHTERHTRQVVNYKHRVAAAKDQLRQVSSRVKDQTAELSQT